MVKTTYKIDGMMCGMCESHMNDLFRQKFSVNKVTSSFKKGEAVVITEQPLDENKVKEEVENIGYRVLGTSSENYEKKKFSLFRR